jgi:hypothetical protein
VCVSKKGIAADTAELLKGKESQLVLAFASARFCATSVRRMRVSSCQHAISTSLKAGAHQAESRRTHLASATRSAAATEVSIENW